MTIFGEERQLVRSAVEGTVILRTIEAELDCVHSAYAQSKRRKADHYPDQYTGDEAPLEDYQCDTSERYTATNRAAIDKAGTGRCRAAGRRGRTSARKRESRRARRSRWRKTATWPRSACAWTASRRSAERIRSPSSCRRWTRLAIRWRRWPPWCRPLRRAI